MWAQWIKPLYVYRISKTHFLQRFQSKSQLWSLFCPLKDRGSLQRAGLHFLLVPLCSKTISPSCHKFMTNNHKSQQSGRRRRVRVATALRGHKAPERVNPALYINKVVIDWLIDWLVVGIVSTHCQREERWNAARTDVSTLKKVTIETVSNIHRLIFQYFFWSLDIFVVFTRFSGQLP